MYFLKNSLAGFEEIITIEIKSALLKMYFLRLKHEQLLIFHTYYDYRQIVTKHILFWPLYVC